VNGAVYRVHISVDLWDKIDTWPANIRVLSTGALPNRPLYEVTVEDSYAAPGWNGKLVGWELSQNFAGGKPTGLPEISRMWAVDE
jgi:hypothetical protein